MAAIQREEGTFLTSCHGHEDQHPSATLPCLDGLDVRLAQRLAHGFVVLSKPDLVPDQDQK